MKITVFNSSPRGRRGNTNIMVEEFLKGAQEAGAEVENIILAKKNIKHCLGCFICWVKTPGRCVIDDDMRDLLAKFSGSDVVVFATPLYVDNVSGIMKNFMDRLIPLGDPYFEKDEKGEYRHKERCEKTPKMAVISNCGFPEQHNFQVLKLLFKRIARNFHSEIIAEIYRGEGELLRQKIPELEPIINKYKVLLRKAGREVVENSRLSEETAKALEAPLIPYDTYINSASKNWDAMLAKLKS